MDMQNVSNLQIPEGMVKTIHDKDSRLLWGAVGYDTKYAGDTLQDGTPTPDAPIPVQVVAGGQTVTVSDGVDFEVSPISLGSLELCKIGNYQDYIYKSGDDWYVHKEIGKVVLDGTQAIALTNWRASTTSVGWVYTYNVFNSATIGAGSVGAIKCDRLTANTFTKLFDKNVDNGIALYTNTDYGLAVRTSDTTLVNATAINNYLSTNHITVYYPLATPTDTKITDSTLISQLNAVHQWLVRYGYNATVTGNLPIVIDRTNL